MTIPMVARMQGFPDDWRFEGSKTHAYRQVGNALPPPLAEAWPNKYVAHLPRSLCSVGTPRLGRLARKGSIPSTGCCFELKRQRRGLPLTSPLSEWLCIWFDHPGPVQPVPPLATLPEAMAGVTHLSWLLRVTHPCRIRAK